MDSDVTAALIGVAGVAIGAVLNNVLPESSLMRWLSGKPSRASLKGRWRSAWGPLPEGPVKFEEILIISRQRGEKVWGVIDRESEPNKKWDFEGRFNDQFLQLYYFPSSKAKDADFLDYGCYFFRKKADGTFVGYSTGFGIEGKVEGITTDYHELRRL